MLIEIILIRGLILFTRKRTNMDKDNRKPSLERKPEVWRTKRTFYGGK